MINGYMGTGFYGATVNQWGGYGQSKFVNKNQGNESKEVQFKITKHPHELDKLEIVWNMALLCVNKAVVYKAIDFLIKVYYSLD